MTPRKIRWQAVGKFLLSRVLPFLFVVVLLLGAWIVFLQLVAKPPLEAMPVLIMVWATLVVLLLAAFPALLERVKKIKISDFELELQESISEAIPEGAISREDIRNQTLFFDKGLLDTLAKIIDKAMASPETNVNLVVSFERRIYLGALSAYIYFLLLAKRSVNVILVTGSPSAKIDHDRVVGVLSGQAFINQIALERPAILQTILDCLNEAAGDEIKSGQLLRAVRLFVGRFWQMRESVPTLEERLSWELVQDWFIRQISYRWVTSALDKTDIGVILEAMRSRDEYILVDRNGELVSVVPLCQYAQKFTQRFLEKMKK